MHYTNINITNDFWPKEDTVAEFGECSSSIALTGGNTAFRRKWSRHLFSIANIFMLCLYTHSLSTIFGLTFCISYFSAAVIEHLEQGNL